MDAQLKERAQAISKLTREGRRKSGALPEIKEVHYLLYGRDVSCTFCNVDELVRRISQKLIEEPLTLTNMASKGQFVHNAASKRIIRHTKNGTIVITSKNLNEGDNFEYAAKRYPHLVEESKAAKSEEGEPQLTAKQQLQAEYKKVIGSEPEESLTKAELKAAISEKQSNQ